MALPATDSFTGNSGDPLSANWTTLDGSFQIATNNDVKLNGSQGHYAYWDADAFGDDQYATAVVNPSADSIGVAVRLAATRGYVLGLTATAIELTRVDSDESYSVLDTASVTGSAGDVVRLEIEGSQLRGYQNGILRVSATDGTYSSGSAGMWGYSIDANARIESWEGGDLGGGGGGFDGPDGMM